MTKQEILTYCLNDAYALEKGTEELLRPHLKLAKNQPEFASKLQELIDQGNSNAAEIKTCIESFGGEATTYEGMSPLLLDHLKPVVKAQLPDHQVKAAALLHSVLHFGHATAIALNRGGEALGEQAVCDLAQKMAEQKLANARWVEQQLPHIWDQFRDEQLDASERRELETASTATRTDRPAMAFNESIGDKTKSELEDLARDRGIAYSNKTKDELIAELERNTSGKRETTFAENLQELSKSELEDKAKEMGLPHSHKNRDELIEEIEREQR
ncbi:MAG: ferritin-like protein [Candidatus Saccharibacteria bacterium]|jgi:ferritin-like metal-binding protein YciE|nr:ferritin-like protein [Candidatus Saccharibacteria bacterium]